MSKKYPNWWDDHPKRRDRGSLRRASLDGFIINVVSKTVSGDSSTQIYDVSTEAIKDIILDAVKLGI